MGGVRFANETWFLMNQDDGSLSMLLHLWNIKPRESESRVPCFYIFGTLSSGPFVWERGMETENLLHRSLCTDHRDKEYNANTTEDTKYHQIQIQLAPNTNADEY